MIITSKTQTISFSDDVNELLCQIDVKMVKMARTKLNADRFGAKVCINGEDYNLLYKYREILYEKAMNKTNCLKDFLIDDIISRIKQLLNRN
jgi:hypothetical protein